MPQSLYDEIKSHALADAPRECCGLLALDGDRVVDCYPTRNVAKDPIQGFRLGTSEQQSVLRKVVHQGWEPAIYHSHPCSTAVLSERDLEFAHAKMVQVVIGLGRGLVVRAFEVRNGKAQPLPLEVV